MALFAVGIAGTFFTFLWKRNWVFYPPSDFPSASVESYVAAMRGGDDLNINRLTDRVGQVFDDDSLPEKLNHAGRCCMNHIWGMLVECCFLVSCFFLLDTTGVCPDGSFD